MKRILIAVTAMLALGAGGAVAMDDDGMMAEGPALSFSGKAQLGLIYSGKTTHMVHDLDEDGNKQAVMEDGEEKMDEDGNPVYKMVSVTKDPAKTQFQSEFDVAIGAEGVTDGGLTFGVSAALEFRNGDAGGLNDPDVYIGGEMWKITVGSPDPASELAFTLGDIGYDGLGVDDIAEKFTGKHGVGNVGQARVDLTLGAATLAVSVGQTDGKAYVAPREAKTQMVDVKIMGDTYDVVGGKVTIPDLPVSGGGSGSVVAKEYEVESRNTKQVVFADTTIDLGDINWEDENGNPRTTDLDNRVVKNAPIDLTLDKDGDIVEDEVTLKGQEITINGRQVIVGGVVVGTHPSLTIVIPDRVVTINDNGEASIKADSDAKYTVTRGDGEDAPSVTYVSPALAANDGAKRIADGIKSDTEQYVALEADPDAANGRTVAGDTYDVVDGKVTIPKHTAQATIVTEAAVEEMLATKAKTNWAAGVKAELGPVSFGLGIDSEKKMQASVGGDMDGFGGSIFYGMQDVDMPGTNDDGEAITVTHKLKGMGAEFRATVQDGTTINAVYAKAEMMGRDSDGFGVGVSHDLGGGATVQAGFAQVDDQDKFSAGIAMTF